VPIAELRESLRNLGIERSDALLVHSAVSALLRGGREPTPEGFRVPDYIRELLEMLRELVGHEGTLLMPTAPPTNNYELSLRRIPFDIRTDGVSTGQLAALLLKQPEARRSAYPCQNVTALGRHADALLSEDSQATPYAMGRQSAWFKHAEGGGKVLLIGVDHDRSSTVHFPENLYPDEYPLPVFYERPHVFQIKSSDGAMREVKHFLHAVRWKDEEINNFARYVGERHGIYRHETAGSVKLTCWRSQEQLDAFVAEMREGVSMYDSRFWAA
jgi:aminoglycoside N3'-acetyltransferase